jgi:putative redox protein
MSDTLRTVNLDRTGPNRYTATNARGATIEFGTGEGEFSPVELLLAAIGGCTAIDADVATSRHAEPVRFQLTISGDKLADDAEGNRMENLAVTFHVEFPDGEAGDRARAILPRAVKLSHDKLCTVSRTVERGTPVRTTIEES